MAQTRPTSVSLSDMVSMDTRAELGSLFGCEPPAAPRFGVLLRVRRPRERLLERERPGSRERERLEPGGGSLPSLSGTNELWWCEASAKPRRRARVPGLRGSAAVRR